MPRRGRYVEWTPERVSWLRSELPGRHYADIAEELSGELGHTVTVACVRGAAKRYGARNGLDGRFQPGSVPATKGRRAAEFRSEEAEEACRRTQFSRGQLPHNTRPLLSERTDRDGRVFVKVDVRPRRKPNDCWVTKAQLVWERDHGPLPGGMVVVCADHDLSNLDPSNLVAVERAQLLRINHDGIGYCDRDSLLAACAIADLEGACAHAAFGPRTCWRCGAEFVPRFGKQRTCGECLAAGYRAPRGRAGHAS